MAQPSHLYMTTGKTIALTRRTTVGKVMSLLLNMLSRFVIAFLLRMAAVTICSDFEAQENKICHYFHFSPICLPWSDGTRTHDLRCLNVKGFVCLFVCLFIFNGFFMSCWFLPALYQLFIHWNTFFEFCFSLLLYFPPKKKVLKMFYTPDLSFNSLWFRHYSSVILINGIKTFIMVRLLTQVLRYYQMKI